MKKKSSPEKSSPSESEKDSKTDFAFVEISTDSTVLLLPPTVGLIKIRKVDLDGETRSRFAVLDCGEKFTEIEFPVTNSVS